MAYVQAEEFNLAWRLWAEGPVRELCDVVRVRLQVQNCPAQRWEAAFEAGESLKLGRGEEVGGDTGPGTELSLSRQRRQEGRKERNCDSENTAMDAGIKLSEDAMKQFSEMKIHKIGRTNKKFLRLHLNKKQDQLVVDETLECQQQSSMDPYQQFLALLLEEKCCLLIYDFTFNTKDSANKDELVLILWCPVNSTTKERIQFTSTVGSVKCKLGLKSSIECTTKDELSIDRLAEVLGSDVTAVEGTSV
ncbi:destrin [Amblyraja radiata]|uniref:destrin n=1 Tax=Amblyraja radiata TaxID=386614 RepID=UPI00140295CA|nr:destrin [Amblyraja radiata]